MEQAAKKPAKVSKSYVRWTAMGATFVLAGITAVSARPPQAQSAGGSPPPQTAAHKFKNIQVLKDIPADQLIPSMQFISASLGVECDFCHVEHEFDKDDKDEKKTARLMMQMMFSINQNDFDGKRGVTCNTCHRGSPHPQSIPAIMAEAPKPDAMADAHEHDQDPATLPSGAPVFEKYIQALGGEAALDKVSSRVEKGNALIPGGPPTPIELYTKAPDQRVSSMQMPKGDSVTAFNGQAGWITFPGRPLREMSAPDQMAAKLDAEAFYPVALQKQFAELKLLEHPEKVGEHETSVVLGRAPGQPPVKLYFDTTSGLLVRMVHYADTPLGLNPTQVDFADYRVVDGVKTPYRWTIARPSGAFTIQIDKAEQNVAIEAGKFVKPKPAPESAPGQTPAPPPGTKREGPKPPQGSVPPGATSSQAPGAM